MAFNSYMLSKSPVKADFRKTTNALELMKRVKLEEKREKRHTIIMAVAAISILTISGLAISL